MTEMEQDLARLSPRHQTAFAAACAERALAEGSPYAQDDLSKDERFHNALDIAWEYASGRSFNYERDVEPIHEAVAKAIPDMDEPEADEILNYIASAIARSLVILSDPQHSAMAAVSTGSSMINLVTQIYEDYEQAEINEEAWQRKAVDLLESLGGELPYRNIFHSIPEYDRGKVLPYYEERRSKD